MKHSFRQRGFWGLKRFAILLAAGSRAARASRSASGYRPTLDALEERATPTTVPFAFPPPISTSADLVLSVATADLDGDGDLDVLSASFLDDRIAWYDNNGAAVPSFALRTINNSADGAEAVAAADIDG